ncbi:Mor transcription activator family protein [Bacillus sp. CGMCC 1.16541]|uniref:Mor transcription activator family protein n=1 Tax=Bacillus sp. CGMCC 1.16541 TaxID=2185143 RepID=UPI000D725DEA|nr:Mor transcription activator family protein [Bacillus sp. CGMCC 1.16541]
MEKWMEQLKIEDLPEVYQSLAESLGVEGVIKLSETFGGAYMYIPKPDKLLQIARNAAIMDRYRKGKSIRSIAREFKLTDVRIRAIIAEETMNENQISIFDIEDEDQS